MNRSIVVVWECESGGTVVFSDSVNAVIYLDDDSAVPDSFEIQSLRDYLDKYPDSAVIRSIVDAIEQGDKS